MDRAKILATRIYCRVIRVLNLSADYPDAIDPSKTRAIAELIEGTADTFRHVVYSLDRSAGVRGWTRPGAVTIVSEELGVRTCRYEAPSHGIFLKRAMSAVADQIINDVRRRGENFDLVHGHKLTSEGLVARRVAASMKIPFLITVQGNTDQKLLRARPDLVPDWRHCWQDAAACISFSPWASDWVTARLGKPTKQAHNLPCVLASDSIIAPTMSPPLIRTAFNLDQWHNKNFDHLVAAVAAVRKEIGELDFEIAGSGTSKSQAMIDRILERRGIADMSRRVGWIPPAEIQKWMNGAALFALVSRRETFGMVFIEALLAGCPVIHPRHAAIDGYFPGASFAKAIKAADVHELRGALIEGIDHQSSIKRDLSQWQAAGGAEPFRREAILAKYRAILEQAA